MGRAQLGDAIRQIQRLFSNGTFSGLSDASLLRQFVSLRDEEAFAALVARHGPMVLSVCQSVLRESRDAEDAFQATFLVLVRRAHSLWIDESLGGWLHRVAYRVAVRANGDVARRRKREGAEVEIDAISSQDRAPNDHSTRELHEEIARLPESYRRAVVLCYLEGMTQVQAARELRCGEATLRRRLAGARERLRSCLLRRGFSSGVIFSSGEPFRVSLPHLPPSLVESTVQFAIRWSWLTGFVAGSGVIPESVAGLAQGVIKTMLLQSVKLSGISALLAAGVLGTVVLAQQGKNAGGDAGAVPAKTSAANAQEKLDSRLVANEKHAADRALNLDSKTQLIRNKLDQFIDAEFPNGTTLGGLLKYIKQATTDGTFPGIPIDVDPVGMEEAGQGIDSPVVINQKQQPVSWILDQVCDRMRIAYVVRDGYLMIGSRNGILEKHVKDLDRKLDQVLAALKRLEMAKSR
jgi:RNA polymerase sigma factor (sigma-70 family)